MRGIRRLGLSLVVLLTLLLSGIVGAAPRVKVVPHTPGLAARADELARSTPKILERIARDLDGLPAPDTVEIRLVMDASDLASVAPPGRGAPSYADAVAWPGTSIVAVAIRGRQGAMVDLDRVLTHELAHLALDHAINQGAYGPSSGEARRASPGAAQKNGATPATTAQAAAPARLAVPAGQDVDKPLSQMRKAIAKRMTESKTTAPHFYLTSSCDAEPLMAFRTRLNAVIPETDKVSVNDLIIKALALALRRVPEANASFLGDAIRYHGDVHIGVAVALDEGLITPVVRHADQKGVGAIHAEMVDLATRARAKKLKPEEFTGSTFSLSNLGMYGLDHFQAVLNPPEAGILAVGAVKDVPVVKNGAVVPGKRLALTLSIDHRSADGAIGARLLQEVVKLLEHPEALAL